ncbi:MAG: hypothetical protein KAV69_05305, partial [Deltaproteobacteria bacterium]|nr:hypothetical protein [Deltaproteobacteria bacterium]
MIQKIMRAALTPIVVVLAFMLLFPAVLTAGIVDASGNWIHRLGRLWARIIIRTSGVKIEVQGHGHIPIGTPVVFACNHASQFDIPIVQEALPVQFRFVVKK